ncbi:hypothetical protein Nans01_17380 [Nocardiopsis ansamitocini]|uniref:DUF4232 domain-containing protein n=1 Tax=Nocardiopsis ansamitocini TaxID=1670832 RepID=A0A9W6UI61_9ACTN|nr:hypothetical protein Nans01_17380 [Nocardiopsis ansamitocini]
MVLTLFAYACSGSDSENAERAANVEDSASEGPAPGASLPPSIPASPSADPSASAEPSASPSGDADKDGESGGGAGAKDDSKDEGDEKSEAKNGGGSSGGDAGPKRAEDPCRVEDVVVTLSTDKTDYGSGVKPRFRLTAVNTGDQTCTVDVGDKAMQLRVTSGEDRIFSTADCVEGTAATDKQQLRRGIPHISDVNWDRKRSWTDCRGSDVDARPGTYVVTLDSDYDAGAEAQVFRLN